MKSGHVYARFIIHNIIMTHDDWIANEYRKMKVRDETKERLPLFIGLFLLLNGIFKSLKFGEAYLTDFLVTKGFTVNEINNSIYPFWTYSYLVFLVPMTLLARKLSYLQLIWIEAVMEITTYAILIWANVTLEIINEYACMHD